MPITLRPEHEQLIAEAVRSGAYKSPDEVIKHALELLRERDTWLAHNRAKIEQGYASAQRGDLLDPDEARTEVEKKKRAWLSQNRKA